MGAADEPIAGGRHKVFGHPALSVIPQTSTIASHLPRAVGLAIAIHRAHRLGVPTPWPRDAVVVCSLGDASVNHSTAAGAINTALNTAFRGIPVPIVFVCEDNGLGISVPTPAGWIEAAYGCTARARATSSPTEPTASDASPRRETQSTVRAVDADAGVPAPADRPVPRACGQRCRDQLPQADRRDRRLSRATRSSATPLARSAGAERPRRDPRPLRRAARAGRRRAGSAWRACDRSSRPPR